MIPPPVHVSESEGGEDDAACAAVLVDALGSMDVPEKGEMVARAGRLASFSAFNRTRLVARIGNEVVGFLDYLGSEIKFLMVAPAHQRHGVGTALVERALRSMPDEVMVLSFVTNTRALAFYRRCGFEPAGRRSGRFFGVPMENVVLVRSARAP